MALLDARILFCVIRAAESPLDTSESQHSALSLANTHTQGQHFNQMRCNACRQSTDRNSLDVVLPLYRINMYAARCCMGHERCVQHVPPMEDFRFRLVFAVVLYVRAQ